MDGPIALTACVEGSRTGCESLGLCPMRGRWDPVNEAIQQALSSHHPGRHAGRCRHPAASSGCRQLDPRSPPFNRLPNRIPMPADTETLDTVQSVTQSGYKWGFETDIEMDVAPKGLSEDIIRLISARKEEPDWMLEWRLKAYAAWLKMEEPHWARVEHPPHRLPGHPLLRRAEEEGRPEKPGRGRSRTAADVREAGHSAEGARDPGRRRARQRARTRRSRWTPCSTACPWRPRSRRPCARPGVIFCPISEAVREHPDLVQQYLGTRRSGRRTISSRR